MASCSPCSSAAGTSSTGCDRCEPHGQEPGSAGRHPRRRLLLDGRRVRGENRLLADFGAEVIKIEDRTRIDTPRKLPIYKDEPARNFGEEAVDADPDRGGLFNNYCRNKLGVVINMRTAKGRQLAERLIAESSVVSGELRARRDGALGPHVRAVAGSSPHVIYARMSGYGHSGPHAAYRSYGPVVQAMSGLTHISGLPGREPWGGACRTWTTKPPTTTRRRC